MAPRWNPCSYLPRRLQVVVSLSAFLLFCIIFLGTSNADDYNPYLEKVPFGPQLQSGTHQVVQGAQSIVGKIPTISSDRIPYVGSLNPFKAPAHKPPPKQANSTSGETRWYTDFKWRNPFSSSVTMDEERVVLPPAPDRPPIYTYFDPEKRRKDEKSKKAEQELLLIWRRAWWAQGFKPVVLGPPEAKSHPMYRTMQGLILSPEMDSELMRWLAWANMGTGILCNWLAVPMAAWDDNMLSFLRRGEYPQLTQYKGLENGLFIGSKSDIEAAVASALKRLNAADMSLEDRKAVISMEEVVSKNDAEIVSDSQQDAIAYYSSKTLHAQYPLIKEKLDNSETVSEALGLLPALINSHLHTIWQNSFTSGIAVLKPLPQHTSKLIEPAMELARTLARCSNSSIPTSCPPNRPHCKPCASSKPLAISTPAAYRNTSTLFTLGTVPHPYTLNSLVHSRADLSLRFIRRKSQRDAWTTTTTAELLGKDLPAYACLVSVKDAVASAYGAARSFWITAERAQSVKDADRMSELDWIFGFQLPRDSSDADSSSSADGGKVSQDVLNAEGVLLAQAVKALDDSARMGHKSAKQTRSYVEAWNLADTEAWKFVRAYNARRQVEFRKWWEDEQSFQGKGTFDRWMDHIKIS